MTILTCKSQHFLLLLFEEEERSRGGEERKKIKLEEGLISLQWELGLLARISPSGQSPKMSLPSPCSEKMGFEFQFNSDSIPIFLSSISGELKETQVRFLHVLPVKQVLNEKSKQSLYSELW